MSFSSTEISNAAGRPIILYEFERDGVFWRYAASDEDVVLSGNTYSPLAISHEAVIQSGEVSQDELKITAPLTLPVVQQYLNSTPNTKLNVRLRRRHVGLSDAGVVWVGTLNRVRAISDAAAELVCDNALATLSRGGLRLAWTRQCTHMLYDNQCRVNRNAFKRTGVVDAISGLTITSGGLAGDPVGALLGGYVEWTTPEGFIERRTIVTDSNGSVVVVGGIVGLTVGASIAAYFGCPRSPEVCNDRFRNLPNYGGFPHIPQRSPFDGNPVF